MKILWVAGEATNWAIGYCRELAELGNEVLLVGNSEDLYDRENLNPGKVKVKLLPFKDFNFMNIIKITKDDKFVPDVVFGSHIITTFNVWQVANTLKKPWGMMVLDIPSDLLKYDRKRMKLWNAYFDVLKQADSIIFNTEVARDEFFKYTNNYITNVFPYAFNIPEEYIKKKINTEPENYVVSVCRLTSIKNCGIIPIVIAHLKDKPKYIAIGRDGGKLEEIQSLCKQFGVEFEHKPDVSEEEKFKLIYNAKALIYPQDSEYIGGLSPFEAMSVGTPALVSDYKILRDLYERNVLYSRNILELAQQIAFTINLNKKHGVVLDDLELAKQFAIKNNYITMANKINTVLEAMK
jgi:glycosyltransferase involved in cell wall biosynthesis